MEDQVRHDRDQAATPAGLPLGNCGAASAADRKIQRCGIDHLAETSCCAASWIAGRQRTLPRIFSRAMAMAPAPKTCVKQSRALRCRVARSIVCRLRLKASPISSRRLGDALFVLQAFHRIELCRHASRGNVPKMTPTSTDVASAITTDQGDIGTL